MYQQCEVQWYVHIFDIFKFLSIDKKNLTSLKYFLKSRFFFFLVCLKIYVDVCLMLVGRCLYRS